MPKYKPALSQAAIQHDSLKEALLIHPGKYVTAHMSQNSGAPADFEAIEEFCGFNEVALDAFQLATKQQLGVEVSTWIIIAACTMLHMAATYRQVYFSLRGVGGPWTSCQNMKDELKDFLNIVPKVYIDHEHKRFEHVFDTGEIVDASGLSLFPFVTCIVDGVPVCAL